jgi:hypothetical protein
VRVCKISLSRWITLGTLTISLDSVSIISYAGWPLFMKSYELFCTDLLSLMLKKQYIKSNIDLYLQGVQNYEVILNKYKCKWNVKTRNSPEFCKYKWEIWPWIKTDPWLGRHQHLKPHLTPGSRILLVEWRPVSKYSYIPQKKPN